MGTRHRVGSSWVGGIIIDQGDIPNTAIIIWPELWLTSEQMGRAEKDLTVEQKQYLKMKNGLLELARRSTSGYSTNRISSQ